jgi:hypothetical protein
MVNSSMLPELESDLQQARSYLAQGEFGKSRVCARRAAGKAARIWLSQQSLLLPKLDPFQALWIMRGMLDHNDAVGVHIDNLLRKVDKDFSFPQDIDWIASAEIVISKLTEEGK